jgi:propionyl-CoA carboxylase alpha chain
MTQKSYDNLKYMPVKKQVDTSSHIVSPMPGIVKSVPVKVGDMVVEGAEICTVEAMKMQNKLVASRPGKVNKVSLSLSKMIKKFLNIILK